MAIELVVFDLDGTLVDSLGDLTNSANYALQQVGLPPKTLLEVRHAIGNGVNVLMSRLVGENCLHLSEDVLSHFLSHYRQHCQDSTLPYQGIVELLQHLASKGVTVAVYSNKSHLQAVQIVNSLFGDLVQYVVGTTPNGARKPDPFGLIEILSHCNVTPEQTLYVGDSIVDIETAKRGKVRCISVAYGYDDKQELIQHNDIVLDSVQQLSQYIDQLID